MIETNEPKDGDFIAYIEDLQKQQAARLVANAHQTGTGTTPAGKAILSDSAFEPRTRPTAAEAQRAARERLRQAAPSIVRLLGAALPALIGLLVGLHWLIAESGPVQLVIAVFLLIFGARRFKRVMLGLTATEHAQASALISQFIARPDKR
jgi:hypothetical protein